MLVPKTPNNRSVAQVDLRSKVYRAPFGLLAAHAPRRAVDSEPSGEWYRQATRPRCGDFAGTTISFVLVATVRVHLRTKKRRRQHSSSSGCTFSTEYVASSSLRRSLCCMPAMPRSVSMGSSLPTAAWRRTGRASLMEPAQLDLFHGRCRGCDASSACSLRRRQRVGTSWVTERSYHVCVDFTHALNLEQ